ncbi:MAG: hypothetical protein AABX82_09280, partial [Nanoarchaeota archaeon]
HYPFWVAHIKNNYLTNYVTLEGMREVALFFLDKQKKDSKYVDFIEKIWQKFLLTHLTQKDRSFLM